MPPAPRFAAASPRALPAALAEACATFASSTALTDGAVSLRYDRLLIDAARVADRLRDAGVAADEPVQVLVANDPRDIVAVFGIWLAGAVAVPVHRTTPPDVRAVLAAKTRGRFEVDGTADAPVRTLARVAPPPRPLLDGAAFVIFTSGSTGEPKGVVVGHDAFHGKLLQIDRLLEFAAGERTLLVLNITFSFGLWLSLLTLLRGGVLEMRAKFDPMSFCDDLVERRITRVGMVPTMMRVLFADPRAASSIDRVAERGDLRQILIGGESLGRSLADTIRTRFAGTALVDIYGSTETATCDFFAFPRDYAAHPGCIGRPSPNVAYRIVDDAAVEVADDAVGELQIATPYAMSGYLDAPDLTASAFDDHWFRTGDLARRVDDVVELMGRKKEVISRGGNKVTPVEIEQSLCAHPDVAAAMAVGVADPIVGERIHVLLVARSGASLDVASIERFLATRLERFKQPDRYYFADELPTGRTGKADRTRLRSMIEAGDVTAAST